MSQAADPIRPETSPTAVAGSPPARRLCPFCGTVNERDAAVACSKCGMEDTPATRDATRARIGPWHVLQSRNPAAPGMKFSTLLSLIRKGQVTQRSIVRGPTTSQFWTVAARVKGLSREFGVCYQCSGQIESTANICPHCQKLQEPPINPDVLLEASGETAPAAGSSPARRARPYVPEPTVNVDTDDSTAMTAQSPPRARPAAPAATPSGILTAKELATAFQLDFQPKPAPPRKRRRSAKTLLVLILLGGVGAGVTAYLRPDLRDQSVEWVRRYSAQIKARLEAQRNQQSPAAEPTTDELAGQSPDSSFDSLMAAPKAEPPSAPASGGAQASGDSATADSTDGAQRASDTQRPVEAAPKPQVVPEPQPAPAVAAPMPAEPAVSEAEMISRVRSLWSAAIDAEGDGDYAKAVRNYEQIRKLPRTVWPGGLDIRLNEARKHVR